jgi:hypothetical protein
MLPDPPTLFGSQECRDIVASGVRVAVQWLYHDHVGDWFDISAPVERIGKSNRSIG